MNILLLHSLCFLFFLSRVNAQVPPVDPSNNFTGVGLAGPTNGTAATWQTTFQRDPVWTKGTKKTIHWRTTFDNVNYTITLWQQQPYQLAAQKVLTLFNKTSAETENGTLPWVVDHGTADLDYSSTFFLWLRGNAHNFTSGYFNITDDHAPSPTQSPSPPLSSSSSLGMKLGVGLGVGLGVVLLGAAIFALYALRKRRRNLMTVASSDGDTKSAYQLHPPSEYPPSELHSESTPHEFLGSSPGDIFEAPGDDPQSVITRKNRISEIG
ncbi:hypothetical protein NA57DRAFT_79396 [Rhizodiscina lignyota]|uniref:Mid2 domain-containing protein n=1 Tax=Rhizodiscina lignyota TaxID=1504668 RepID=A0A9P4M3F9_9PEZI|nr:hypothetical protein NA57DRAFT_79396 [Rhizodiscina lignyota]